MGSGKTSYAIQMINANPDKSFIYITPFLKEVQRIKEQCQSANFYEPREEKGKFRNFHELLTSGKNIVSTHSLFRRSNDETKELLANNDYILILDEVLDILEPVDLGKDDLPSMLELKLCHVDEKGFIVWDKPDYDGKYNSIKELSATKGLFVVDDIVLLWLFPKEIFDCFSEVYVLTYMFKSQMQHYYFQYYWMDHETYQMTCKNGVYDVLPHDGTTGDKSNIKIKIVEGSQTNNIGKEEYALSNNWYKQHKKSLPILRKNLQNFFRNIASTPAKFNLWTTFKDYQQNLSGDGYASGFLAHNARATNDYRHKTAVAYTVNRFFNPFVKKFFSYNDIKLDEDGYALSEMLQFLFRSAIREGQEIYLYLPSKRMRRLLNNWLSGQI